MIRILIDLYLIVLFLDVILSYLPQFQRTIWRQKIKQLADLTCKPVRKVLPQDLPFDFSPIIVFMAFRLVEALW